MANRLRSAVAANDAAGVARHAHAIAGSSGNLGADGLRAAAKALERAGHDGGSGFAELLAELEGRAAVVFRSIDSLRGVPAAAAVAVAAGSGPLTLTVEARAVMERLQAALGDFDLTAASSALADLDRAGMPPDARDLIRLRAHMDSYEYEEARVLVTRMLEPADSGVL